MASQTQTVSSTLGLHNNDTSNSAGVKDTLINDLEKQNTKPLWAQMNKLNPPLPNPTTKPHLWSYKKIRPHLLRAGEEITEKQAERRVVMLVNPERGLFHVLVLFSPYHSGKSL